MGIADKFKQVIGIEDIEDDDEMITEEEIAEVKAKITTSEPRHSYTSAPQPEKRSAAAVKATEKRFSVTNSGVFKLVLIEPKAFEECTKLVDSLKGRRPIIINLERLETETARKIFDFMSGATYALNGSVQKVANNIFIFAPENVDIAASKAERPSFETGVPEDTNIWK